MKKIFIVILLCNSLFSKTIINLHTDKKDFFSKPFLSGEIIYNMYDYPIVILNLDYTEFNNFIYTKKQDKFFYLNSEAFILILKKYKFIKNSYFYFVVKDINEKKLYKNLLFKINVSETKKYDNRDFDKNDRRLLESSNINKYKLLSAYNLLKTFKIVAISKKKIQFSKKYTNKYKIFLDNFAFENGELEYKILLLNQEKKDLKKNIWYYCIKGNFKKVKLYIDLGFDINRKDRQNHQTCLQYAALNGHYKLAKLLLKSGADVNFHNQGAENAYLAAKRLGYIKIANLLEPYTKLKTRYIKSNSDFSNYGLPKHMCYRTSGNYALYKYCNTGSCDGFVSNYALYQLCKYNNPNGFYKSERDINIRLYLQNGGYLSHDYFTGQAVVQSGKHNSSFRERKNFILYLLNGMVLIRY